MIDGIPFDVGFFGLPPSNIGGKLVGGKLVGGVGGVLFVLALATFGNFGMLGIIFAIFVAISFCSFCIFRSNFGNVFKGICIFCIIGGTPDRAGGGVGL